MWEWFWTREDLCKRRLVICVSLVLMVKTIVKVMSGGKSNFKNWFCVRHRVQDVFLDKSEVKDLLKILAGESS